MASICRCGALFNQYSTNANKSTCTLPPTLLLLLLSYKVKVQNSENLTVDTSTVFHERYVQESFWPLLKYRPHKPKKSTPPFTLAHKNQTKNESTPKLMQQQPYEKKLLKILLRHTTFSLYLSTQSNIYFDTHEILSRKYGIQTHR